MSIQRHEVGVTADLTVLVPRGTDSTLAGGARAVLEDIDAVRAVHDVDRTGFRPRSTDVAVDLTANLALASPDRAPEAVADALADGFGVRAVTVTGVDDG